LDRLDIAHATVNKKSYTDPEKNLVIGCLSAEPLGIGLQLFPQGFLQQRSGTMVKNMVKE